MAPAPFDPSARIEWSPVWSLRDRRFKYLPTSLLYFFYSGPAAFHADSNGCAAGNTLEEAIVQGFLELVERDAYAIWWYNRLQRAEVDLESFQRFLRSRSAKPSLPKPDASYGCSTSPAISAFPTYVAILHWMQNGQENIEFGSGAHFDPRIAMLRTLTELNQFLSIGLMGGGTGEKSSLDGITPLRLAGLSLPDAEPASVQPGSGWKVGLLDNTRRQVDACVDIAARAGLDFLVLDQTRPDVEVPVVRVIVPGLRHFLSPLRAGPALRCSGQTRIAGSAAAGKRTHAVPSAHLRGHPACALPQKKKRAADRATSHFRPAERSHHARSARGRNHRWPASMVIRSAWESSAPRR